ncbi:MAG: hypothetical protein Q4B99_01300 [Clostridia bacterium]|nr:hypothetical protein [Clostridia bacterium]
MDDLDRAGAENGACGDDRQPECDCGHCHSAPAQPTKKKPLAPNLFWTLFALFILVAAIVVVLIKG